MCNTVYRLCKQVWFAVLLAYFYDFFFLFNLIKKSLCCLPPNTNMLKILPTPCFISAKKYVRPKRLRIYIISTFTFFAFIIFLKAIEIVVLEMLIFCHRRSILAFRRLARFWEILSILYIIHILTSAKLMLW